MNKNRHFWRGLLLAACAFGFSSGAMAQYEVDESTPLITNVSGTGETQLTSNCTWKPEKGSDNYLPENNEAFYDEGNYLGTLIDGNQATYWHSDPTGMDYRSQLEYIQADLGRDDLQRVYLMFNRRYDPYAGSYRVGVMPTNFNILASNTPDDENSWVKVASLSQIPSTNGNAEWWPYFSPLIDFGGTAYRYVRVVPTAGTNAYWCPSEMQFFPAKEISDYRTVLQSVVDSIYSAKIEFYSGTTPGYVSYEDSVNYTDTFADILDLIDDGSATQDQLKEAVGTLRKLVNDTYAKIIPLPTGNYFIKSVYPAFADMQPGKTFAMTYNDNGYVTWAELDEQSPRSYFYIKRLDDGNYLFQNLDSGKYVGTVAGDARQAAIPLPLIKADSVEQILVPSGHGSFYIVNNYNTECYYHALDHKSGSGNGGWVSPASTKEDPELWAFVSADTTNLAALRDKYGRTVKADLLADSLSTARAKVLEVKAPSSGLIKEASQMSTNCLWQATSDVDKLIDGNHLTYFHSTTNMNLNSQDEWLQVDLNRDDISKFIIEFYGRNDGTPAQGWHDTPNNIVLKATNTPDDEASWTEVAHLTKSFPGNYNDAHYVSPQVDMKANYRYVRMYVKGVTSGQYYWNLSEFQMFTAPVEASANSLYAKVPEVKTATDELETALNTAEDHIANLTVDGTEMKAINAALAEIAEVENSSERVQAIVNTANNLYNSLFVADINKGLIKEVNTKNDGTNQLWSNCTWMDIDPDNDNYSFNAAFIEDGYNLLGTLIDNDDQTYWHSNPNGFNVNSQQGYFQIDLKRSDLSSFVFMLYRRHDFYKGGYRVGQVPRTGEVYATNDESVGTDVSSPMDSWTQIGTITGIPDENTNGVWPYYTSAVGNGTAYRFLRVRLHESSQGYFGLSGFNVYNPNDMYDDKASQYVFVDGMKDAADKMKAAADAVQAKLDAKEATLVDGQELQEAIDAVQALYQDHNGLNDLITRAQNIIENSTEGTEMGQLSDNTTIEPVEVAIDAAKVTTSNTEQFNTLKKNLEDAVNALEDAIVQPVPGKWYYILSATSDADSSPADGYYAVAREKVKGAALYVLSNGGKDSKGDLEGEYTSGNQLRWGMDDITKKSREGDVNALWRFVAAPDSFGRRAYYIQNLRTGYYIGNCNTSSGDYYYYQRDTTSVPYRIDFVGDETFNLVPLAGARAGVPISFGDNARQVRGDNVSQVPGNRASFTFEEFSTEDYPEINIDFYNDSARILTLPFAVSDIDRNEGVKAYSVHSVARNDEGQGIGIGLKEKTSFAAGEPFILVVGDTTKYSEESGLKALVFDTPEADAMLTKLVADTVNGLIGTFPRTVSRTSKDHDYLFLRGTSLRINNPAFLDTTKYTGYTIYAHTGYIDPVRIVDQEGEPDVVMYTPQGTFSTEVINAIAKIAADSKNGKVNVYTVDGALVKQNVKAADALKGLKKGLYIVGKQKVLVK